ncbi:ATP-binding cassette domain-containing protein [Candidatus Bathyarchaeota archaeon]|nr:ATP-binding cassette domain-containing protein [Candidatus Bathyarchaeota archaeon]
MSYAIHTENLTKKFGGFVAVKEISFDVNYGEIFGLLGPNGAGKTTAIKMLCTLLIPSSGRAEVGGYDVVKSADEVRKRIGVVTEKLVAYDRLNPLENLSVFGRLYGMEPKNIGNRSEELLKLVELWDFRKTLVGKFSTGMRQRLNIIRALLHDPEIIFLDEPTIGLDPTTAHNIRELMSRLNKESKKTLLLTTHYMDEADHLSDRIGIIDYGKIIALDKPQNLKASVGPDATLEEAFIKLTGTRIRDEPTKSNNARGPRFRFGGRT